MIEPNQELDYYNVNNINPCPPQPQHRVNNNAGGYVDPHNRKQHHHYYEPATVSPPIRGRTPSTAAVNAQANDPMHNNMQKYTESYYWRHIDSNIEQVTPDGLKDLKMPLARVKRMIKSDDEVKMLSAEAPIILSKGCEIFIGELALRCWFHTRCNKRKTLQKVDVVNAVCGTSTYDFLIDVISCEDVSKPRSVKLPK